MFIASNFLGIVALISMFSGISPTVFLMKDFLSVSVVAHGSILSVFFSLILSKYLGYSILFILFLVSPLISLLLLNFNEFVSKICKITKEESSLFVMAASFALGIFLMSLFCPYSNMGENIFFGNPDNLEYKDAVYLGVGALISNVIFYCLRNIYYIFSFDEPLAKRIGMPVGLVNKIIIIHTGFTVSLGCYILGFVVSTSVFIGCSFVSKKFSRNIYELKSNFSFIGFLIALFSFLLIELIDLVMEVKVSLAGIIAIMVWMLASIA